MEQSKYSGNKLCQLQVAPLIGKASLSCEGLANWMALLGLLSSAGCISSVGRESVCEREDSSSTRPSLSGKIRLLMITERRNPSETHAVVCLFVHVCNGFLFFFFFFFFRPLKGGTLNNTPWQVWRILDALNLCSLSFRLFLLEVQIRKYFQKRLSVNADTRSLRRRLTHRYRDAVGETSEHSFWLARHLNLTPELTLIPSQHDVSQLRPFLPLMSVCCSRGITWPLMR